MKTHLLALVSLVTTATLAPAADPAPLGLAERRAIKAFQDNRLKPLNEALLAAAAQPAEIQIDWDRIAIPGDSASYSEDSYWVNIFFLPATEALKAITKDEMGREALKAKLKKIVFTYDYETAPASNYPNGVKFEDGVLTLNFRPGSNSSDIQPRTEAIIATLEPKL